MVKASSNQIALVASADSPHEKFVDWPPFLLKKARDIVIVPGIGLPVVQHPDAGDDAAIGPGFDIENIKFQTVENNV